jgi:hypothetical protein
VTTCVAVNGVGRLFHGSNSREKKTPDPIGRTSTTGWRAVPEFHHGLPV